MRSIVPILLAALLFPTTATAQAAFPLRVAADGRHLEDQNGVPFLLHGDTAWSLITALSKADAAIYLEDRRQKGFNTILVNLIEHFYNGPVNQEGQAPFLTEGDYSTPNEAYFAHADWVLQQAGARGILILLTPSYLGWDCGAQGWCQEMLASSLDTLRGYGRFLGARYAAVHNLLWVEGGDADAAAYGALEEVEAILEGVLEEDPVHLRTAHCYREQSAIDCYDRPWLTVNATYSSCANHLQRSRDDYGRNPVLPFFFFEGTYENEGADEVCLRSQAYTSILSGSAGHLLGTTPIWAFDAGWEAALDSPGTMGMTHLLALLLSRPWARLVPDPAGAAVISGGDSVATALTDDGGTLIAYGSSPGTITVDLTCLSGTSAQGWWFDPATGSVQSLGTFPIQGQVDFTPEGSDDWVLVLDDAALGFGEPGQQPIDTLPPAAPINLQALPAP